MLYFRFQISEFRFLISDFGFHISDCNFQISVSDFRFQIVDFRFQSWSGRGNQAQVAGGTGLCAFICRALKKLSENPLGILEGYLVRELLVFLEKILLSEASGFKTICYPSENVTFWSFGLQNYWLPFGKRNFLKLGASKILVFLWKM